MQLRLEDLSKYYDVHFKSVFIYSLRIVCLRLANQFDREMLEVIEINAIRVSCSRIFVCCDICM